MIQKKNPDCEANIEMQMTNADDQKKRSLYYASQLYSSTLESGNSYRSIPKVFQIMVVNFNAFHSDKKVHHKFLMQDKDVILTDTMQIHFLELPKLEELKNDLIQKYKNGESIEDLTRVEFWTLLIAYIGDKEIINILSEIKMFKEELVMVGKLLTSLSTNKDEWELLYGWEKYNRDKFAYLAAAREEGIEQGIEQGIKQGLAQGEYKKAIAGAKNLISMKIGTFEQIAQAQGLELSEVQKLAKEMGIE